MTKATQGKSSQYKVLVKQKAPGIPVLRNVVLAFLFGGTITTIGQVVLNLFLAAGMPMKEATGPTAGVMIFLGALLTGLGVYDELAKYGGMGTALPITGFANSIVSPAMEYKTEGFVLGVGSRMFTIAGPVIVYGLLTAMAVALVRWLMTGAGG